MPNRIIKESIRESYSIDALTPEAEVTFYRLLTYADDFGIFKADPRLINNAIFPLKKHTEQKIAGWLNEIAKVQMIVFYVGEDGKPYGIFTSWNDHNSPRNKKSKHPHPTENESTLFDDIYKLLQSIECNCTQMKSIAALIQSNTNQSNPKQKTKDFTPPVLSDVIKYFNQKGYSTASAKKAFEYYDTAGWKDARGNQVKNWKQKMISVWFKPENEITRHNGYIPEEDKVPVNAPV